MSATTNQATAPKDNEKSSIQILARETFVYLSLVVMVWGTWRLSQVGLFTSGDDVGYWIGVVGAVMMLILLLYPLRKYFRFAHNWGNIRFWFWAHVVLGIFGPLLILLHSNFRTGSLNAAVALYSMIVVALSGVAGRFIFQRVNRGLLGEQTELSTLKGHVGMDRNNVRSRLAFAPQIEQRLKAFEDAEMEPRDGPFAKARAVFWLPVLQYLTYRQCAKELDVQLRSMAVSQKWSKEDLQRRRYRAKRLVDHYLNSVVGVAQFSAYTFLFSLWHVAHIPFVYILILTALVHVYAVHAY
jgi:ABC-type multidrug transport system fused ATPase/permease subunit